MSGIFLTVWCEEDYRFLQTTIGGYPHVTLVYTGNSLNKGQLTVSATKVLFDCMGKTITLSKAYVNSFSDKPGHMRHDVLLDINEKYMIEDLRIKHIKVMKNWDTKFSMRDPHVTYGIYETREEAEQVAKLLNQNYLPKNTEIIGVTI